MSTEADSDHDPFKGHRVSEEKVVQFQQVKEAEDLKALMKTPWTFETACLRLEHHPDWRGVFALDTMSDQLMVMRNLPGSPGRPLAAPRRLTDAEDYKVIRWFNRAGWKKPVQVREIITEVALKHQFNPLQDYLNECERKWVEDGKKPRADRLLVEYCGIVDSEYARRTMAMWLISAVARAMDPGCKVDTMIVLKGRQGAKKSMFLRVMTVRDEWFSDKPLKYKEDHKDTSAHIGKKWIIEVGELSTIRATDTNEWKTWQSRPVEEYRPPYGKSEIVKSRSFVLAGTTNEDNYLHDRTGNRRFWPHDVGHIDIAGLKAVRDLIWGEIVHRYKAGEKWWLEDNDPLIEVIEQEQQRRAFRDSWEDTIEEFITGREWACVSQIERECLGPRLVGYKGNSTKRIQDCLRRLGWAAAITDGGRPASVGERGEYKGCKKWVPAERSGDDLPF